MAQDAEIFADFFGWVIHYGPERRTKSRTMAHSTKHGPKCIESSPLIRDQSSFEYGFEFAEIFYSTFNVLLRHGHCGEFG